MGVGGGRSLGEALDPGLGGGDGLVAEAEGGQGGDGSGGSIYLECRTIHGTNGTVSAHAGDGNIHPIMLFDERVDLFALGLTFYYILTAKPPFQGLEIQELFLGKGVSLAVRATLHDVTHDYYGSQVSWAYLSSDLEAKRAHAPFGFTLGFSAVMAVVSMSLALPSWTYLASVIAALVMGIFVVDLDTDGDLDAVTTDARDVVGDSTARRNLGYVDDDIGSAVEAHKALMARV